jgi:hypothetical protein
MHSDNQKMFAVAKSHECQAQQWSARQVEWPLRFGGYQLTGPFMTRIAR